MDAADTFGARNSYDAPPSQTQYWFLLATLALGVASIVSFPVLVT
jgi:hypothetical protein